MLMIKMDAFRKYEFKEPYKGSFDGAYKRVTRFHDDLQDIARDINIACGHIPRGALYYDCWKDFIVVFENESKDEKYLKELEGRYYYKHCKNYSRYDNTSCWVIPAIKMNLDKKRKELWKLWDKMSKEEKDTMDINR